MISAYLKLVSDKSGEIRGPVRDRDNDKNASIALLTIDHGIVSPRDLATGLASGKRQHSPITFTKEPDNTSPIFYQLLTQNEPIIKAEIFFYGFGTQGGLNAGRETNLYKITLAKAFVSKMELAGRMDEAAREGQRFPLTERISLVYDSILWEWKETPKAEAQDLFSSGAV
jgi:type VI secretion system secreted protein Hcp